MEPYCIEFNRNVSNRSYQVQSDGILSEEAPCHSGVPQGSVIGLLLFLLYINDLPGALGDSAFLFADDVKMKSIAARTRMPKSCTRSGQSERLRSPCANQNVTFQLRQSGRVSCRHA